jgi:hypothetical protein
MQELQTNSYYGLDKYARIKNIIFIKFILCNKYI